MVDTPDVADWLKKLAGALGGDGASPELRRLLAHALEHRAGVELIETIGPAPVVMSTTLEQVREGDLVVSRPTVDGRLRPLAKHAPLKLVFDLPTQRVIAETESLGRTKITSGAGGEFFGYRLAIPRSFETEPPPATPLVDEDDGFAIEAALALPDRSNAVRGLIEDLSPTGMTLRCRNAHDRLERGSKVHLKVRLPEPVGLLAERVSVIHVEEDEESGQTIVEFVFERRQPAIAELCRHGGQRALRHRQAG
ncbi:MAG: PilZ domain-containing protein [Planctomycetota bacterium]